MRSRVFALLAPLALCCILAGCSGLASAEQQSVYHDNARIAQGVDTYTTVMSEGSLYNRHIGEQTGLETWLQLSVPAEGGTFCIGYDADVSAGDFKIVFVSGEDVDTVCEGTDEGSRTFELEQGNYALKAVSLHAGVDIALKLQATEGIAAVEPNGPLGDPRPVKLDPLENH